MKRNLMAILSIMVILAFAMPVMTNAQAGKANFAGNWVMNAEKSNLGQPPAGGGGGGGGRGGFGSGPMEVKQDASLLTQIRTRTGQDGTVSNTETKVTLDGKETVNTTQRGESKLTATWSADGKSLTIVTKQTFNMNGESRETVSTAVWSLTDANTLSITTTRTGQNGEVKTTAVYDKK